VLAEVWALVADGTLRPYSGAQRTAMHLPDTPCALVSALWSDDVMMCEDQTVCLAASVVPSVAMAASTGKPMLAPETLASCGPCEVAGELCLPHWLVRLCGHAGRVYMLEQAREAAAESVRQGRGGKVFLAG
jgi:hypothetical protein